MSFLIQITTSLHVTQSSKWHKTHIQQMTSSIHQCHFILASLWPILSQLNLDFRTSTMTLAYLMQTFSSDPTCLVMLNFPSRCNNTKWYHATIPWQHTNLCASFFLFFSATLHMPLIWAYWLAIATVSLLGLSTKVFQPIIFHDTLHTPLVWTYC